MWQLQLGEKIQNPNSFWSLEKKNVRNVVGEEVSPAGLADGDRK